VLSLSVITHSSPDSHGNPKYFGRADLHKKGKKMMRNTKKKVRKVIPFIVGSESQVVMEWKKSGMIERQRDGCMKGEYDI